MKMDCSGARFDFSDPEMTWNKFLPEFKKVLDYLSQLEAKVNVLQARNKDLENQLNRVHSIPSPSAAVTPTSHHVFGITQESIDKSNTAMKEICERLYLLKCAQESAHDRESYLMGNREPVPKYGWKAKKIEPPYLTTTVIQEPPKEEFISFSSSQLPWQPEFQTIVLHRKQRSLGFSFIGGCGFPEGDLPVIVRNIFANGAAAEDGRLKQGDQIISVNGESLEGVAHGCVLSVIKNAEDPITLVVIRPYGTLIHSTPADESPVVEVQSGIHFTTGATASGIRRRR